MFIIKIVPWKTLGQGSEDWPHGGHSEAVCLEKITPCVAQFVTPHLTRKLTGKQNFQKRPTRLIRTPNYFAEKNVEHTETRTNW